MKNSVIARRLIRTRRALGCETQRALTDEIGIASNQYNIFESGHRRISLGIALLIYERFGISLDWIYCGDASGLPASLQKKLRRSK
jgi:transcriptional regulator with XRE-family HTH domain